MSDVQKTVEKYLQEHPEVQDLLEFFKVVQEEYESYMVMLTINSEPINSNSMSSEGRYNADVSGIAR